MFSFFRHPFRCLIHDPIEFISSYRCFADVLTLFGLPNIMKNRILTAFICSLSMVAVAFRLPAQHISIYWEVY